MLVTNKEAMWKASRSGYAIPAINTQGGNFDIIWAVCRAAQEMESPVILAHEKWLHIVDDRWFRKLCQGKCIIDK